MIRADQAMKPTGAPAPAAIPAEQLASAIAQSRLVYEGCPDAEGVLDYLRAVLDSEPRAKSSPESDADIPVQAGIAESAARAHAARECLTNEYLRQTADVAMDLAKLHEFRAAMMRTSLDLTRAAHLDLARRYDKLQAVNVSLFEQLAAARAGAAGGADASIAKETDTGAGAEPVAGAKKAGLLDGENQPQTRMDAGAAPAVCAPTIVGRLVVEVDSSQIDAALTKLGALQTAQKHVGGVV